MLAYVCGLIEAERRAALVGHLGSLIISRVDTRDTRLVCLFAGEALINAARNVDDGCQVNDMGIARLEDENFSTMLTESFAYGAMPSHTAVARHFTRKPVMR